MPKYLDSKFTKSPGVSHINSAWWLEDKKKLHEHVQPLLRRLEHEQRNRDYQNKIAYSMWIGHGIAGLTGDKYTTKHKGTGTLRVNLARAICSAANSKMAKNKVRVLYQTEGGDFSQQARSKRLTKVINGTINGIGFHEKNARAQLDSTIFDLGAVYFWRDGKKVQCERVPGCELRVDYLDARYGEPSQLHRTKTGARSELLARYKDRHKLVKAIKEAKRSEGAVHSGGNYIADIIDLTYSWHLPSIDGAKDGLFTLTIDGATLEASPWENSFFPFVFQQWEPNPFGFYSQSVCSILLGIQHSINRVVQDIQDHVDLSTGFVAVDSGSSFNTQALTNMPWRVCETTGAMPQYIAPPAFQQEKLAWLEWLVGRGHEDTGLSQLFVTSRKPDGLDSGKALREYNDQNSERFQMAQLRYEQSYVDASNIIRALYEDAYKEEGDFKIKAYGAKFIESIDWEAARLDEEDYICRPVPTGFLPSTPAGKLQTIEEMLGAGLLGKEEAMLLLDYPDLERANMLNNAPILNIEKAIEGMLDPDKPKYRPPEGTMNLGLALKMVTAAYNEAQASGAPPENLKLLNKFLAALEVLLTPPQPAAPAAPPAPMPAAPMPEAAPVPPMGPQI